MLLCLGNKTFKEEASARGSLRLSGVQGNRSNFHASIPQVEDLHLQTEGHAQSERDAIKFQGDHDAGLSVLNKTGPGLTTTTPHKYSWEIREIVRSQVLILQVRACCLLSS